MPEGIVCKDHNKENCKECFSLKKRCSNCNKAVTSFVKGTWTCKDCYKTRDYRAKKSMFCQFPKCGMKVNGTVFCSKHRTTKTDDSNVLNYIGNGGVSQNAGKN